MKNIIRAVSNYNLIYDQIPLDYKYKFPIIINENSETITIRYDTSSTTYNLNKTNEINEVLKIIENKINELNN